MSKIGLIGGSFNPIHNGHLIIANTFFELLGLDKLFFIPANVSPFKIKSQKDFKENSHLRFQMVNLAVKSIENYFVSNFEINNNNPSYTINTVTHFSKQFPNADFYWLLGGDQILQFDKWKDWEKILELVRLVVADRKDTFTTAQKKDLSNYYAKKGKPIFMDSPLIEISSTEIRERAQNSLSLRGYVPESVENFIFENNIY